MFESDGRIVVSGLTKSFGSIRAVDAVTFTVEPGSVTGFLGPNGAGKTTTLRMMLNLVTPDAGATTFGGRPYANLADPTRAVGAALEATGFHPARTGRDHLRVYCAVAGLPMSRADEVLAQAGLAEAGRRKAGGYSLGMRQRLALATALLGEPPVLILDEPANGLDPEGIAWMRHILRDLADEGRTVLVSSHILSEIEQLADRVVILDRGRLVREGELSALAGGDTATLARTPDADGLIDALAGKNGTRVERVGRDRLLIRGIAVAEIGHAAWRAHVELHELTPQHSDLERLFFDLTRATSQEPR